jgi:hypothetical protein
MPQSSSARPRRHPLEVSATPQAVAAREAVGVAGGTVKVAGDLGVVYQTVQKWMEAPERMRGAALRQLVRLAGYKVPLVRIRPDLYGELSVRELGYQPPLEPQA